ncbi:hypothetical protein [Pseudomonas alloputida]|uniref:hypothetical protein n=1 Tax=Pseudomonas TaxID=286 RepID=UPI003EEFD3DC
MTQREALPTCVQGSPAPMFAGDGPVDLKCRCGQVLVSGYRPRQLSGIALECFQCGATTLSEFWPSGEPLPRTIVTLGRTGRYRLAGTVDIRGKAGFTTDQEIERIGLETSPRPHSEVPLELSHEALHAFENDIDSIANGALKKSMESTTRAFKGGNKRFLNSPLAWALCHLHRCIDKGEFDLDDEDSRVAISYIQISKHLISRWQHHPLFHTMSKALVLEFPHCITQLLAATYLTEHGNPIGFNDHVKFDGQSPDLFLNANIFETISIEVKAPQDLQWPNAVPSVASLEKIICKQIQKASSQITGALGGVVVIGASWAKPEGEENFAKALSNLNERKKISTKVAGVVAVCIRIMGDYYWSPMQPMRTSISSNIFTQINLRFAGEQFLKG